MCTRHTPVTAGWHCRLNPGLAAQLQALHSHTACPSRPLKTPGLKGQLQATHRGPSCRFFLLCVLFKPLFAVMPRGLAPGPAICSNSRDRPCGKLEWGGRAWLPEASAASHLQPVCNGLGSARPGRRASSLPSSRKTGPYPGRSAGKWGHPLQVLTACDPFNTVLGVSGDHSISAGPVAKNRFGSKGGIPHLGSPAGLLREATVTLAGTTDNTDRRHSESQGPKQGTGQGRRGCPQRGSWQGAA